MRGQSARESDWDKRRKVVPEKVIRKAIRDRLHETMQYKLVLKDNGYFLVSGDIFNKYLDTIKHNEV